MPVPIIVNGFVTVIRPVFSGAFGIAPNTRCLVVDIPKTATPEEPAIIVIQLPGTPLLVRIPPDETLEGQFNIMEAMVPNQKADQEKAKQPTPKEPPHTAE